MTGSRPGAGYTFWIALTLIILLTAVGILFWEAIYHHSVALYGLLTDREAIKPLLNGGVIYHCGPVVAGLNSGDYRFVAAGPTTSTREEPYQGDVMRHFHAQGVIGKGGMGPKTLAACQEVPGLYLHAIGGAASLIAQSVKQVLKVYKLDFGVPEAMWVIEVKDFPAVVTMDAHGNSLHADIDQRSKASLDQLLAKA